MTNNKIKILVADDHPAIRDSIIELIEGEPTLEVVGEAVNGGDLLYKFRELNPDVILVDISMPVFSGMEAVKKLKSEFPQLKALFLSMYDSEEYAYYCIKSGGLGLVSKNLTRDEIIEGIKTVNENKYYFGRQIDYLEIEKIVRKYENISEPEEERSEIKLSYKELRYLELLNEGMTSKEIEAQMELLPSGLDHLRSVLMKKLNLRSLPELVQYAVSYFIHKSF